MTNIPNKVLVWDLPTRLFHWLLVALVAFQWASAEGLVSDMDTHAFMGYALLTLLLFRLLWGFFGSETARFSHFIKGPKAILAYLKAPPPFHIGHNPLGALSVIALLTVLLVQAITGLFSTDDILTEGALAHLISDDGRSLATEIHEVNFNILLALIALHITAILFYRFAKGHNLVKPMITGTMEVNYDDKDEKLSEEPKMRPLWLALILLMVAAAAIYALVRIAAP